MNVRVTYTVYASTLRDAVRLAEERLAEFAIGESLDLWRVSLEISPDWLETAQADEPSVKVGTWAVNVSAHRGVAHGP